MSHTTARPLLSVPAVAVRLGLSAARVYELIRDGTLPAVRLGRQIRVDGDRLEEFISLGGQALPGGWRRDPDAA